MVDEKVKEFAEFLNKSLECAQKLLNDNEDLSMDWIQASWELLVERALLSNDEFLDVYSAGADFNGSSSRITKVNALPTHKIVLASKNGDEVLDLLSAQKLKLVDGMVFEEFVSFKEGFYSNKPNFDCILVNQIGSNQEMVFYINDIIFRLEPAL